MSKGLIYLAAVLGGSAGSYLFVLLGQGYFSPLGILGGLVGAIVGIWIAVKLSN